MHAPPTPAQVIVRREARLTKLGEPPAAKPKTAVARRVKLNDHLENDATLINHVRMTDFKKIDLRPQISHPMPQNMAPTRRPMLIPKDSKGALK